MNLPWAVCLPGSPLTLCTWQGASRAASRAKLTTPWCLAFWELRPREHHSWVCHGAFISSFQRPKTGAGIAEQVSTVRLASRRTLAPALPAYLPAQLPVSRSLAPPVPCLVPSTVPTPPLHAHPRAPRLPCNAQTLPATRTFQADHLPHIPLAPNDIVFGAGSPLREGAAVPKVRGSGCACPGQEPRQRLVARRPPLSSVDSAELQLTVSLTAGTAAAGGAVLQGGGERQGQGRDQVRTEALFTAPLRSGARLSSP